VAATEEGVQGAVLGSRLTQEAGESIRRLAESVTESAHAAEQIAAAAGQQHAAMAQLAAAMSSIQQTMTMNLLSTQQTERAAADLNGLAGRLRQVVEQYQV
jgi:methyl-accepting chemotaxis protein